jgi:2-desacetyl-2-hydroxyethyl bacteriochlorophyllide A dehydrogenase
VNASAIFVMIPGREIHFLCYAKDNYLLGACTMKAALLWSPENVVMEDVTMPAIAEDEVRIRPSYAGICGTDISIFKGHREATYPFILGHEFLGQVVAIGEKVRKVQAGQRVIVEPNYPCGSCALCRKGRGAVCAQKGAMGVNMPGCFSEFAVAPAEFVWPVPASISDQDAVTIEPLTVSLHGFLQSGVQKGDTVAVLGCGVVGLLLIHAAASMGVRVIAHDRYPDKQAMARSLGAELMPDDRNAALFWDQQNVITVFECAGVPETVELALQAAPRGSNVMLLGLSSKPASFVPVRIVREGINIHTSMIYDHPADFARAIDLVATGMLHPSQVVTHTYAFADIGKALEHAAAGKAGKILINME